MSPESLIGMELGKGVLQRLLGQGTMGAVYLASPAQAVKVFLPVSPLARADSEEFQKRLTQIIAQGAALDHRHILSILDYGVQKGFIYQVTPYIAGENLQSLLASSGALPFTQVQIFLEQLAAALDYAHARGVLHRDFKPENILLTPERHLLVADFGQAGLTTEKNFARARRAVPGMLNYIAPEYVLNKPLDERADLYSLGVVLYQMVTGSVPFQNASLTETAMQHVKNTPPSPRLLRADLPQAAEQVILRALAKAPAERYLHAQDLASAFRLALKNAQALPAENQGPTALARLSELANGTTKTRIAAPRGGGLFDPKWQAFTKLPTNALEPLAAQEQSPAAFNSPIAQMPGTLSGQLASDQQPFADNSLQVANPAAGTTDELNFPLQRSTQATTGQLGALSPLLHSDETTGAFKLAEPVKIFQAPVEGQPGRLVTGFLPVADKQAEEKSPRKRASKGGQIVSLLLAVLIVAAGSGTFFWFTHRSAPQKAQTGSNPNTNAATYATATAGANIILSDDLSQNVHNWIVGSQGSFNYAFKDGAYHIANHDKKRGAPALLPNKVMNGSFAYSLTMEQLQGNLSSSNNQFGVILDATIQNIGNKQVDTFYAFEVVNKPGGQYQFWKYDNHKDNTNPWTMLWSKNFGKEFLQGSGPSHVNTLKVLATGKSFTFMVNGKQVGTHKDSSFSSGNVGMLVNLNGAEVAFSRLLLTYS